MRRIVSNITILILLCSFCCCGSKSESTPVIEERDTLTSIITQIQQSGRLYTTEYHIHKVVTHHDVLRLKGNLLSKDIDIPLPLGERKIAIPMDAKIKAYIDFSEFSEQNIERTGTKITILLPDPKVVMTSSKINQDNIHEYVGLTRSRFTDKELTNYEQQGRQAIINSIPSLGITETAQQNATRVLVPILVDMGYREEDIIIAFRNNLNILQLINSNLERQ